MIVNLKPQSAFSSIPGSDTLFGAMACSIRLLFGDQKLSELLLFFDQCIDEQVTPPFTISSIFPAVDNILLFPRPLIHGDTIEPLTDRRSHRAYKKLTRAKYVSASVLEDITKGEFTENSLINGDSNGSDGNSYRLHADTLMSKRELDSFRHIDHLMTMDDILRYRVSGAGAASRSGIIYDSIITVTKNVSLFFLLRVNEEKFPGLSGSLKTVLRYMGETGFGGGKSIGRGYCDVDFTDDDLPFDNIKAAGNRILSLSLLHPNSHDKKHFSQNSQNISGHIVRRKGIINPELGVGVKWKPTLTMLSEGSVFPRDGNRSVYGNLYRLGNIRIYGLGYVIPIS